MASALPFRARWRAGPRPNFSLSGLKTAVRLAADEIRPLTATDVNDLCASFQAAVVDTIIDRIRVATRLFREKVGPCEAIVAAGGVASNDAIRRAMARYCGEAGLRLVIPPPDLCTDNGAMIAWAGLERLALGLTDDMTFAARPRWPLDAQGEAAHHGKA